ncbi:two-component system sensor histidine kinase QseC [Paraburkholderia sp. GAS448]|uniref:ATP-binding protein n=1 Tax=Paraburkholderia sp. GAS448 TaxID=3035136 RepID=UPI003D213D60
MMASIRRRLMVLVLASIVLVWSFALVSSYHTATQEAEEWEDVRLVQFAQTLAVVDEHDLAAISRTRFDAPDEDKDDDGLRDLLFQVSDTNGRILASSPELASLSSGNLPSNVEAGERTLMLGGQLWQAYTLHDASTGRTVQVLEIAASRSDLAASVARRISRPMAFALPVLALLVWVSIGRSLAPLKTLQKAIRTRDSSKLEPIDMGRAPTEVRPLVDAINHLLSQLRHSIKRERAFTADAAHELRTPLAGIKVQAQVALSAQDVAQQQLAMRRVVQGVDRSAHLADQLLLLARLDENETIANSPVELTAVARDTVVASEQNALRRGIRVTLVEDAAIEVIAEPTLMGILLHNLIDNAIKYGDVGGQVEVVVQRGIDAAWLTVRDDGPGVKAEDRARLTDRFFRATGTRANGSGLGLSIVVRIVEHFGAQLRFSSGIDGRGLAVEISFPRHTTMACRNPTQRP